MIVYILKLSNGDLYKGLTDVLERRLLEHHQGKVTSTKMYRPITLIGYEVYINEDDARRREKFLKTTEGRRLLRQQYRDAIGTQDLEKLHVVHSSAERWPSG